MGSSASKAARTANTTVRKYPTRIPTTLSTPHSSITNMPYARPPLEDSAGPKAQPRTRVSSTRDDAINLDASDPHLDAAFNARLAQLGPVQATPTLSNSSTYNFTWSRTSASTSSPSPSSSAAQLTTRSQSPSTVNTQSQSVFPSAAANPAVELLTARERISKEAEENFENLGRRGSEMRRFVDITTVRRILLMRDELGKEEEDIEQSLGLAKGIVRDLGRRRVISGGGN